MTALRLKGAAALFIDQPRNGIWKMALGIAERRGAAGFDVQTPARPKAAKSVVDLGANGDETVICRARKIWSPKGKGLLKTAVLIEDEAWLDQRRPREVIKKALGLGAIFSKIEHGRGA